jgi:hypothetical protein
MGIKGKNTTTNLTVKDVTSVFGQMSDEHEIPKLVYYYKSKDRTDQKILQKYVRNNFKHYKHSSDLGCDNFQ